MLPFGMELSKMIVPASQDQEQPASNVVPPEEVHLIQLPPPPPPPPLLKPVLPDGLIPAAWNRSKGSKKKHLDIRGVLERQIIKERSSRLPKSLLINSSKKSRSAVNGVVVVDPPPGQLEPPNPAIRVQKDNYMDPELRRRLIREAYFKELINVNEGIACSMHQAGRAFDELAGHMKNLGAAVRRMGGMLRKMNE